MDVQLSSGLGQAFDKHRIVALDDLVRQVALGLVIGLLIALIPAVIGIRLRGRLRRERES